MIRQFLAVGGVGLMMCGVALAQSEATFKCHFSGGLDKTGMVCRARGIFDAIKPATGQGVTSPDDVLQIVCDGQEVFDGGMRIRLASDLDDTTSVIDTVFTGIKGDMDDLSGHPCIRVEDLSWANLSGYHRATLKLGNGVDKKDGVTVISGGCEFNPAPAPSPTPVPPTFR